MPFTFAHPAIILPLTKLPHRYYSLTALIIGAITPDFEYFLRLNILSIYSHTILGIFYFDLPLVILLCFTFHLLVRDKLVTNLPTALAERLNSISVFNWSKCFQANWIVIIISAVIGIGSHLLWDSFTHEHGYFVSNIQLLMRIISIAGWDVPVYKIIQHSSTVIGLLLIIAVIYNLPRQKVVAASNRFYWLIIVLTIMMMLGLRMLLVASINIGSLVVTMIAGVLLGIIIASLKTINDVSFKKSRSN